MHECLASGGIACKTCALATRQALSPFGHSGPYHHPHSHTSPHPPPSTRTHPRDLLTYKGEPDPFKGDVPNARVREFAKEVVEVLFNAAPVAQQSGSLMAQGKIQGFGSGGAEQRSIYTGSGGAGSSSSSRAPPPASGSIASIAGQVAEGPLGQSIASAATALGDFLQKNATGNSSRLNVSTGTGQAGGGWEHT